MYGGQWFSRRRIGLLILFLAMSSAQGQLPEQTGRGTDKLPEFIRGVYTFLNADGEAEARLVHQIFYDALQFEAEADVFVAGYELAVQIDDHRGETVTTQVISRRVTEAVFEETHSVASFDGAEQRFTLEPGKYVFTLALTDASTQKTFRDRFDVSIPNLTKRPLEASSLMFGYLADAEKGLKTWRPYAGDAVPEKVDSLMLRFEIYQQGEAPSVPVSWRLSGADKYKKEGQFLQDLTGKTTVVDFPFSLAGIPASSYDLKVEIGEGKHRVVLERTLIIHLEGLSHQIANLDEAIEMLAHIAGGKEIKQMKKGDAEQRKHAFIQFWQQRDPTPGTPINEVMEEYYRRCYYCNKVFGRYRPGWQTDRGRIYILMGPPDQVERHPFDSNADPYEIWFYTKYNREFVFLDENGFGEYRLLTENYDIVRQ